MHTLSTRVVSKSRAGSLPTVCEARGIGCADLASGLHSVFGSTRGGAPDRAHHVSLPNN